MTYCVAMRLDAGLLFASDSRTNAGVDHIASFRKMSVFEQEGERLIVLLSAGNLATTQSVISLLRQRLNLEGEHLLNRSSMYDVAELVGRTVKEIVARDANAQSLGQGVDFGGNFIVGGQIRGEEPRLFHVYAQGNFIEACEDTPYFQIGESKYGKPIIDRVINTGTSLKEAAKCTLISFDSTIRSNLSVGLPIDMLLYRADSFAKAAPQLVEVGVVGGDAVRLGRGAETRLRQAAGRRLVQLMMRPRAKALAKTAVTAGPIRLPSNCSVEQGFAQIFAHCLKHIRANEAGLLGSDDPEYVHQMRVGLRRLRSGLSLFKRWFKLPPDLLEEIHWLNQTLAAARDAEVLAGVTLPEINQALADKSLQPVQRAAQSLAQQGRLKASTALQSPRYFTLMEELDEWLKAKRWREQHEPLELPQGDLADLAQGLLSKRMKKLRAQCRLCLLVPSDAGHWHQLRITVKKLRYAQEFLGSTLDGKTLANLRYLAACQHALGQLNDAQVGAALLAQIGQKRAALQAPCAFARGALWAQSQQRMAALPALLQGLGL